MGTGRSTLDSMLDSGDTEPKERRIFKVLAIDGGGIRGLYSAQLLAGLEERFGTRTVDHFDLICGTSTGGLIALALALGHPASDIANLYKNHGPRIFSPLPTAMLDRFAMLRWLQQRHPQSLRWLGSLSQFVGRGKYSNENLREVLTELFGDKRIGDALSLLCIASYSLTTARPYVIKYNHPEGRLARDNTTTCVDAALATSAAPTYFPVTEVNRHKLIDGGVYANNPAVIGFLEALDHFVGHGRNYDCVDILSIETPGPSTKELTGGRLARGVIHWRADLINVFTQGQAQLVNRIMTQLSAYASVPCTYVRLDSCGLSPRQSRLLTLDNASPKALRELEAMGADAADRYGVQPAVKAFYSSTKTYRLPHL